MWVRKEKARAFVRILALHKSRNLGQAMTL
jgi:hypothetical protein